MATRTGSRAALLVVDVQVGVVDQAWDRDRIVGNASLAVRRARDAGVPVVWVQHHDEELKRDTPAWQWVPELEPLTGEVRIHKSYNSAFESTDLLPELDRLALPASTWPARPPTGAFALQPMQRLSAGTTSLC